MFRNIVLLILLIFVNTSVALDLDGLKKGLEGITKDLDKATKKQAEEQKVNSENEAPVKVEQAPVKVEQAPANNDLQLEKKSSAKINVEDTLDFDNYCKRVSESPTVVKYLSQLDEFLTKQIDPEKLKKIKLDNTKGELAKTMQTRFNNLKGDLPYQAINVVTSCAQKNSNNKLLFFFANESEFNNKQAIDRHYKNLKNYIKSGSLNYDGEMPLNGKRFNSYWASIIAFLYSDGELLVEKTFENSYELRKQRLASEGLRRSEFEAKKKEEAEKKAVADAEAKKRAEEARAYAASPDGQLRYSYQHFQIVELCHDIRKGYAVQFVNSDEFSEFKSQMKQIEKKLKKSVTDKNTDRLWDEAEKGNRKTIAGDMFEYIKLMNKQNFVDAKNTCDMYVQSFRTNVNEVLGKQKVKKNF